MVWFLRASIFALVGIVFLVWSLYNVPILYKVKFKCVSSSDMRSKSSFKTELYLRVILGPRGSQLGWEKQRGKFSIMGERAPGMLLRTNQFQSHLNACLWSFCVPNRRPTSIMLLSWSSYTEEFTCKLNCSLYLSGSCRSHPKRNWKTIFFWGGGGKQSTRRCANNKSMKLILFSPSHCFPWFFNIIVLLPKDWHNSKTYFNLKSGIKVIRRLSLRLPLQWFIKNMN